MISESMKKKYFDRWTDSSYGNDVITTSIGYNYIDEKEDSGGNSAGGSCKM